MRQQIKDLSGQQFGKLTAISCVGTNKKGNALWRCLCDCGNETTVVSYQLTMGKTKSCGCAKRETPDRYKNYTSIKQENPRLYTIWSGMKQRCFNPKSKSYRNYGARGIVVCDEWKESFSSFCSWSKEHGYSDSLSIDRIDPNGNYCPENCRWIPINDQTKNTRLTFNNRKITINGVTKTLLEFAEESGISPNLLSLRISRGMREDRLLLPIIHPGEERPYQKTHNGGRLVTINGETHNIKQWCRIYKISPTLVYLRIKRGFTIEKAITTKKLQ